MLIVPGNSTIKGQNHLLLLCKRPLCTTSWVVEASHTTFIRSWFPLWTVSVLGGELRPARLHSIFTLFARFIRYTTEIENLNPFISLSEQLLHTARRSGNYNTWWEYNLIIKLQRYTYFCFYTLDKFQIKPRMYEIFFFPSRIKT